MVPFLACQTVASVCFADNPIAQTIFTADPAPMVHDGVSRSRVVSRALAARPRRAWKPVQCEPMLRQTREAVVAAGLARGQALGCSPPSVCSACWRSARSDGNPKRLLTSNVVPDGAIALEATCDIPRADRNNVSQNWRLPVPVGRSTQRPAKCEGDELRQRANRAGREIASDFEKHFFGGRTASQIGLCSNKEIHAMTIPARSCYRESCGVDQSIDPISADSGHCCLYPAPGEKSCKTCESDSFSSLVWYAHVARPATMATDQVA